MNDEALANSAVLYFACEQTSPISWDWFDRARKWLEEYDLEPILFTAAGAEFALDDTYVLADSGGDMLKWGEMIPACRDALENALRHGQLESLGLDAPRPGAKKRSEWLANANISSFFGSFYLGVDAELIGDLLVLTDRACHMAKGLLDVRYGTAYKMPLAGQPASYAIGCRAFSLADFRQELQLRREGVRRQPNADDVWHNELVGEKRYLNGLFRGAYPANILSEAHVERAGLKSEAIGRLSRMGTGLWLWELSEAELSAAEEFLADKRVLVSQEQR